MKTEEELNALKEEVEALNKKLAELTEEELQQVAGGMSNLPSILGKIPGLHEVTYIRCTNPNCSQHYWQRCTGWVETCFICGWKIEEKTVVE